MDPSAWTGTDVSTKSLRFREVYSCQDPAGVRGELEVCVRWSSMCTLTKKPGPEVGVSRTQVLTCWRSNRISG